MQVDVQATGEALIPADKLRQIVGAEDSEPTLTLETEEDAMHIRGRDAHFKVYGYPAGDFPPIPDMGRWCRGRRRWRRRRPCSRTRRRLWMGSSRGRASRRGGGRTAGTRSTGCC